METKVCFSLLLCFSLSAYAGRRKWILSYIRNCCQIFYVWFNGEMQLAFWKAFPLCLSQKYFWAMFEAKLWCANKSLQKAHRVVFKSRTHLRRFYLTVAHFGRNFRLIIVRDLMSNEIADCHFKPLQVFLLST